MRKLISILLCAVFSCGAFAKPSTSVQSSTALKVRGQRRATSLARQSMREKNQIDFLKLRINYRPEILSTPY